MASRKIQLLNGTRPERSVLNLHEQLPSEFKDSVFLALAKLAVILEHTIYNRLAPNVI
jgi:hypothetical protein